MKNEQNNLMNILLINVQAVMPHGCFMVAIHIVGKKIVDIISEKELQKGLIQWENTPTIVDFEGDIVIPGLIDLHVHGCGGADTMDASAAELGNMATALLHQGTTAFLATTMTSSDAILRDVLSVGKSFHSTDQQAKFLGFHLEGPCISPDFRGAQKVSGSSDSVMNLPGNAGKVKILTFAPELPAAGAYMKWAKETGVILSTGHSGASYEEMKTAIEEGVRYLTHAFNAMPGIHHRAPGLLAAALLDPRVTIELIADGVHVHPAVLEMAVRLKGVERVVLVSDGTRAVGMPDGEYDLGGQQVRLSRGKMTLPNGTIAGSAQPLLAGIRFMTEVVGRPLHEAVRMATLNPATLLGIENNCGTLHSCSLATFLRLTPELKLKEVWVRGRCQYSTPS